MTDRLTRRREMELRFDGPLPEWAKRYIEYGNDQPPQREYQRRMMEEIFRTGSRTEERR